jgi:DNA-binding SARP family transcriptional activator
MIGARQQRARRLHLATALPIIGALAVVWELRPGPPPLPRSLAAPLTVEAIEAVAFWLVWLIAPLLAIALLVNALTAQRWRRGPHDALWVRASNRSATVTSPRARRQVAPRLVIPAPRPRTPQRADVQEPMRDAALRPRERERQQGADIAHGRPRISLLGPLAIAGAKRSRRGLRASALELVAYLALHRRSVQRDELLEALWPGEDPKRTRLRLHQAVRDARRLLGGAVTSERDHYSLDRAAVDVDVDELERLLAQANRAEGEQAKELLETSLRLFRVEPLSGSDYAWSQTELPRLRATFVDLLERVGRRRLEARDAMGALDAAERGLEVDVLNESLWRLAMEAESALGLREAVSDRYERLRALLDERLGLEPAQQTRRLHHSLLGQS